MKAFTISAAAAALLAAFAYAAPTSIQIQVDLREFEATITFEGAADASFTKEVPTDGSYFYISERLSVSHIKSEGGATCTFYGTEGSVTTVVGAQTVDVGPPQPQASGVCRAF